MAELVDALVSGTSGSNTLEVRVFLCPPYVFAWCKVAIGYDTKSYGVVAQLIERYVRIVEVVGLSPISSTTDFHRRKARAENRVSRRSAYSEILADPSLLAQSRGKMV